MALSSLELEDGTPREGVSTLDLQPPRLIVHEADAWHPLSPETKQNKSVDADLSASGVSSAAVEDGGDSQQLHDVVEEKRLSGEAPHTFGHTGAHFPSEGEIERPDELPDSFDDDLPELDSLIRCVTVQAAGSSKSLFLPLSELERLITPRHIKWELTRCRCTSNLHKISRLILDHQKPQDGTSTTTTRRRIFAILCLMDRANDIQAFVQENVFDSDLPFEFEQGQVLRRSGRPVELFQHWEYRCLDSFKDYQGRFLAPYFKFMTPKLNHYTLHRSAVLPFMELEAKDEALSEAVSTLFSIVHRVAIHSAHHDYCSPHGKSDKMYFAVKQLQKSEALGQSRAKAFNREVKAYKRLNSIQHPHIVRLLATYSHHDRLHMIFPWANGNLYQFWENQFPHTYSLQRGQALAQWVVKQFLGLADGLRKIHICEIDPSSDEFKPEDQRRTHGRHGDIKPENILWFKSPTGVSAIDKLGSLMISDLGSTEFHGTFSKDVQVFAAGGFTETYKSPEFDFAKQISPESDIWSFGCVLLQFIVWYVLGWPGIEEFTEQRKRDSNFMIPSDHFFNFYKDENSVEAKASVRKASMSLREHSASSDFILDLLDLVESRLLRLRVTERASCDDIVIKLQTIKERCDRDERYCVERTPRDVSRTPTDHSDKVQVQFSAEMAMEYTKNIEPDPRLRPKPSDTTMRKSTTSVADTETADEVGENTPNASGVRVKSDEESAAADDLHTETSPPSLQDGETARLRVKVLKWVKIWMRKLACFR